MNKNELMTALADKAGLTKNEAGNAVTEIFNIIAERLAQGDRISIPDFGVFTVEHRAGRSGRNPQTGEAIQIKAARVAKFKAGKNLKEVVNENSDK